MEERLNNKLDYLNSMAKKYYELNLKTHNKYQWRLHGINEHIEALENLRNDVTNEWNEAYEEDLKEIIEK